MTETLERKQVAALGRWGLQSPDTVSEALQRKWGRGIALQVEDLSTLLSRVEAGMRKIEADGYLSPAGRADAARHLYAESMKTLEQLRLQRGECFEQHKKSALRDLPSRLQEVEPTRAHLILSELLRLDPLKDLPSLYLESGDDHELIQAIADAPRVIRSKLTAGFAGQTFEGVRQKALQAANPEAYALLEVSEEGLQVLTYNLGVAKQQISKLTGWASQDSPITAITD
jgi:hypothetical protein